MQQFLRSEYFFFDVLQLETKQIMLDVHEYYNNSYGRTIKILAIQGIGPKTQWTIKRIITLMFI